eukprot:1375116-Pyramimonas_sp.AAC.1
MDEKRQAITRLAEVNGHGLIPYDGEDLAAMARPGKAPTAFFRPLTKLPNRAYTFWSAAIHIASDSTRTFYGPSEKEAWPRRSPAPYDRTFPRRPCGCKRESRMKNPAR